MKKTAKDKTITIKQNWYQCDKCSFGSELATDVRKHENTNHIEFELKTLGDIHAYKFKNIEALHAVAERDSFHNCDFPWPGGELFSADEWYVFFYYKDGSEYSGHNVRRLSQILKYKMSEISEAEQVITQARKDVVAISNFLGGVDK